MTQSGLLTDPNAAFFRFEVDYDHPPEPIALAGRGFVGGKAVGLMYAACEHNKVESWCDMPHADLISIPETTVLTSEFFDRFVDYSRLTDLYTKVEYEELVGRFLKGRFPESDRAFFRQLIGEMDYPLAIRSSSLLEDNLNYSFAGIYLTLFIPNHGDRETRLNQFETAVKRVFASTYNPNARAYRLHHDLRGHQEKMSVMVQRLVGTAYDGLFYPPIAGVAFSRNYFPWSSRIKAEDGLVRLVFGLGTRAVGRNYARVFSPAQPMLRPEGSVVDQIVRYSQEVFDALELKTGQLVSPPVSEAAGTNPELPRLCSVLGDQETLREPSPLGLEPGDRPILTFRSIVREGRYMPLVPLVRGLLKGLEERFGLAVDIEFACKFEQCEGERKGLFSLLQCRPLGVRAKHTRVRIPKLENRTVIFTGQKSMGNGRRKKIKHLIYVPPQIWRSVPAAQLARRVGTIARNLEPDRFILAGPGRWGTNNPDLGIPVTYGEIHNASVLVEIAAGQLMPELSYGTHFFGDLLATDSFYLPVFPDQGDRVNEDWILARPNAGDDPLVHLVTLEDGFTTTFDGHVRKAAVYL
jgi:hypothetical protein